MVKLTHALTLDTPLKVFNQTKSKVEGIESSIIIEKYIDECKNKIAGGPLNIESIDINCKVNGIEHHTSLYDIMLKENPVLVVRRGAPFRMVIKLERPLITARDSISFTFFVKVKDCEFAKNSNGMEQCFLLLYTSRIIPIKKTEWKSICDYVSPDGKTLFIQVFVPSKCIVNKWKFCVHTRHENHFVKYPYNDVMYVLFNAWCPDDDAYLPTEEEREEYILNDFGAYFTGTARAFDLNRWYFAQYEPGMLDYVFYLLNDVLHLPHHDCWSILSIVKAFSNEKTESLIIDCPWTSNYRGGTNQMKWPGSKLLLGQFYKTKKPVNLGHCYVFNCLLVSVFRVLGIAARPVTGFNVYNSISTKNVLIANKFIKDSGETIPEMSDELSCHCNWAEVFMKRQDIGHDYNGWQWIARPEGPTSIASLKKGELEKPYSGLLSYFTLHPLILIWVFSMDCQKLVQHISQDAKIVTKRVGKWSDQDISADYLLDDGKGINASIPNPLLPLFESSTEISIYKNEEEQIQDITGSIKMKDEKIIGDSILIECKTENSGECEKFVDVYARLETILFTGKVYQVVMTKKEKIQVPPFETHTFTVLVEKDEYLKKLTPELLFKFVFSVTAEGQTGRLYEEVLFRLAHPKLFLRLKENYPVVQQFHTVIVDFINMPATFKNTRLILEEMINNKNVLSFKKLSYANKAPVHISCSVRATKPGKYMLKATLATEFGQSYGYLEYNVKDKGW
ncbi:annulin-like isoform X2 [Cimex lectularius]|uniref:Transglutaminase-like domain-containing protein n=1 Tax=Cimex lectularius TaxID=79782 RepID=A0A8I6RQK2_CIMLE|nr:annulin-like isoform X2 [Cimex lectularius]